MLVQCYMSRFVVTFSDVLHLQENDGSVINYAAVILHAEHITTPRVVVNIKGATLKNLASRNTYIQQAGLLGTNSYFRIHSGIFI